MTNESDYKLHFPALILIRLSFLSLFLSLSLSPLALFLPFVGSEQTGKCSSGPPLLFLFHTAYLHLSSFVIILHARITKTTHSGSVQFRLLVRTIAISEPRRRVIRVSFSPLARFTLFSDTGLASMGPRFHGN